MYLDHGTVTFPCTLPLDHDGPRRDRDPRTIRAREAWEVEQRREAERGPVTVAAEPVVDPAVTPNPSWIR
jgi:hypothetical protein